MGGGDYVLVVKFSGGGDYVLVVKFMGGLCPRIKNEQEGFCSGGILSVSLVNVLKSQTFFLCVY